MNFAEFVYTVLLKPRILKQSANWVLKRIIPARIETDNTVIFLNPDDPVISGALTLGMFENEEIAIFKQLFEPDMTFVDVGANVGLYSAMALSVNGFCGKLICLEPHRGSRLYLEKNIAANRQSLPDESIVLSAMAASDFEGETLLHKNPENKGDNRLYPDSLLKNTETIAVTTIDKLCADNNVDNIHFLKIDVQGAEGKAIAGATKILGNSADCIILSEFWPYGLSRYGSTSDEYLELLQGLGFSLFELEKNAGLSALDKDEIARKYQGRKYTNIVGVKGKYLEKIKIP